MKIRPEFSNYHRGNGRKETILKRLQDKWHRIDGLVEKHGSQRLGSATMESINRERQRYHEMIQPVEAVTA